MATKTELKKLKDGKLIGFRQIMKNIETAFEELSGSEIEEVHNQVCAKKVEYTGDSIWEYTGEID